MIKDYKDFYNFKLKLEESIKRYLAVKNIPTSGLKILDIKETSIVVYNNEQTYEIDIYNLKIGGNYG